MYYAGRIFAVVGLGALAIAAFFSIRLAIADTRFRERTPESVARALEILPNNTAYLALRALQLEYDNQDATALLERAAMLNPLASAPRIQLGLSAETRGDFARAEKWLLEAARVDHQFEPRWTLANFYFRWGREELFWKWMRSALEMSHGDRRSAFDLARRAAKNSEEVFARAIPQTHDAVSAFLNYEMDRHDTSIAPIALRLAAMRTPEDTTVLEAACDFLIQAGKTSEAEELWRRLGHKRTGLLNNSDFSEEPRGHGFDWRPVQQAGVTHTQLASGHRIHLSGRQPESCELLQQAVVLEPGKRYRFRWESRTQNLGPLRGFEWTLGNTKAVADLTSEWHSGSAVFMATVGLVHITLGYHRPTGEPRAEDSVEIRRLSLMEEKP